MRKKLWLRFQRYRKNIGYIGILICVIFSYTLLMDSVPDKMYVEYGKQPDYSFGIPMTESVVDSAQVFANQQADRGPDIHMSGQDQAGKPGAYQVVCKLFGVLPFKQISVQEVGKKELLPAGTNVGIYVKNQRIMIIGTGEVTDESGSKSEPAKNVVKSGDFILEVDGEKIKTKDQLVKKIAFSNGDKMELQLLRDGEKINVSLTPVMSREGLYQLGIWVRDDIAGVGTLTYVTDEMEYGALGHGVTDADVGNLLNVKKGFIYQTTILEIHKGKRGQPGEMAGMINYNDEYKLGSIDENTNVGIYGTLTCLPQELQDAKKLPVTYKEGIKKGKAQIISSVEGDRKAYDIEIESTNYHSEGNNKGIQFRVTDKKLLEDTGGIVQGMSGSPIVQDGSIIGAVTHVFISDSTKGYGVFIENMLER